MKNVLFAIMNHFTQNGRMYKGMEQLTESEYYDLLSVERRRTTLDILAKSNTPDELGELAATVAERETDLGVPDEASVKRVAISLHHCHLPKMATLGVIEYDPDSSRVESRL